MKAATTPQYLPHYSVKVEWDRTTLESVRYFVGKCTARECQWFHFLDRFVDDVRMEITYFISGMKIPEQTVTGGTVESDGRAMLSLYNEMKEDHGMMIRDAEGKLVFPTDAEGNRIIPTDEVQEDYNNDCSRLAVWCHSHVQMPCSPSATDDQQWKDYIASKATGPDAVTVAMVIFNQKDEYFCRLFDPKVGVTVLNPLFIPFDHLDTKELDYALKEKVKTATYPVVKYSPTKPAGYTTTPVVTTPKSSGSPTSQTTPTTTTQRGGTDTSVSSSNFLIAYIRPHVKDLYPLAKALDHKTGNLVAAVKFCNILEDLFDRDNVAWHIIDQIVFGNNPNIVDLYSIPGHDPEIQKKHSAAKGIFTDHLCEKDTSSPEILLVGAEIAFMYTFRTSLTHPDQVLQASFEAFKRQESASQSNEAVS